MKLYLIRHGETVDNVAGLYAGTLDSKLTNHGVEQTKRLGQYFARNGVQFTHIFTSPLSRASKTAEAIQQAQKQLKPGAKDGPTKQTGIVKVDELIERDFGFYEGKPFNMRARDGEHDKNREKPGFVDVETKEAMAKRIDRFLDQCLLPLFGDESTQDAVIAVVAHGMLLSGFWRRLLLRFPAESLTFAPEVAIKKQGTVLEYIGGWSNTGYMELLFEKAHQAGSEDHAAIGSGATHKDAEASTATLSTPVPPTIALEEAEVAIKNPDNPEPEIEFPEPRSLYGWKTVILAVDSTIHLLGLKRQRGGIGSLAHDEGQRKLDSFFKKPRLT